MAEYKVTSPEGKQYVITGPEGASKQDVLNAVFDKLGIKPQEPPRPDRTLGQEIGAGFRRGKERLKSTLGDVLPAMVYSGLGMEEEAKKQMAEAAQSERDIAEYNPPSYRSYKEVTDPRSAFGYAAETIGEAGPDILASLIPGGIGGTAARRIGVAGLRELGEAGAAQIARRGAMGETAGVYLGSYAQNAPEVFQSIYNETGQLEPGVAALFGSVSAGLDSVLPASLLKSMSAPVKVGVVEKILERSGMEPSLLRKVIAQVPGSAAREGLTEGAQEAINISAEDFVEKTEHIWGSKEWDRIVESGVRGAIAGGVYGVPGSVAERARERTEEPARMNEQIAAEEEQLNKLYEPEPPAPPQMAKLERQDLLDAGLKPQSVYLREMAGKDLTIPEELTQVEATLEKMRNNSKMDPEVIASVENVVEAYKSQPEQVTNKTEKPTPGIVRQLALEEQKQAGWNPDWPFVPADLGNADFRQMIVDDPNLTQEEKNQIFESGKKLGVVPKNETVTTEKLPPTQTPVFSKVPEEQRTEPVEREYVEANPQEAGLTQEAAEQVVQSIKPSWANAPAHVTVQSISELPKNLRTQIEEEEVNPRGIFDKSTKTVYLVADNLRDTTDAAITLAHEALGHFGLQSVLGDKFDQTMDDIYRTNKMVRERADEKIKQGDEKITAVEEVLADMAQEVYDMTVPQSQTKMSALQKIISAVRQFLKRIGVPLSKVTDSEVMSLIRQARHAVVKGEGAKPFKASGLRYSKRASNIFSGLNQQVNKLPGMDSQLAEDFKNSMSNVPDKLRTAVLGFLTMPQIEQLYGDALPSLKKLTTALEGRAADMMRRRQHISKNIQDWYKIANKHKAVLPRFFAIANRTTLDQIDVLDPAMADHPLTKEFKKLPSALQDVYKQLREDYKKSSDEYMHMLLQNLKQSKASETRLKMEAKRMKVYLPLFRMGDHWVSFNDQNGERVSLAFESVREAKQAAAKARADGMTEVKEFARLQQITYRSVPPTGFMGSVVKQLQDQGVKPEVIDGIYQTYLSLFPAQSVRQQFRKREGRLGFKEDVFQVYANMATRMANQLANMKNATAVEDAVTGVRAEFEEDPTMEHRDVVDNMQKQLEFIRNPVNGDLVNKASYFSYMWYIAGNVSSALVNLTQIPIVVYPLLAGKYGYGKTTEAMRAATAMYMKGGKDDNSEFLPDYTFGANATGDYKKLYDIAVERSVIRRSTGYELTEARKAKVEDFTGKRAKIEHAIGWIFQNSERANREITLIAAFDLAKKANKSVDAAIEEAISLVNDAHGAALAEIGPRFFQQGIGKVAFTFKRFAQAQIYLLGRLFHQAFKGYDQETKNIARKQILGIAGMSYIFAGMQGMPLYGAVSLLANMLMDDDDEPFDMDALVKDSFGDIGYKGPVNALLRVDIASRTGFNGLVWRDDPKRLAEIGPSLYAIEQAAGPAYGAFRNAERGLKLIQEGEWERGMEGLVPSFVRNGLKAFRLGTEGALTKDGVKITDDIGAYNTFMQIFGFNPAALAEAQARGGAEKRAERAIMDRRANLMEKSFMARQENDNDGVQSVSEAISKFNQKNPEVAITAKNLKASYQSRIRHMNESVDGVYLNPKLRARLIDNYGGGDD
jgi:hypothetical protein